MAEFFVGPVMEKLIGASFDYLKDQVRWQTGMEEELKRLQAIHPQIQAVVSVYSQVEIKDPALNKFYWQLRDSIDEADDVLDEFEYRKREKQASKNKKMRKVRSLMKSLKKRFVKICKRALQIDPSLKKLEEAVQKLYKISAEVSTFQNLLDRADQEQQQEQLVLRETRETGSMTNNELLGRSEEMEFLRQWLRKPYQIANTDTDSYKNISLLSVVGHGGMGKTTLLQNVFGDVILTMEFDLTIWVCVSTNFNAKTVISNILESLKKEQHHMNSLESLQSSLKSEVMFKKFLLVLDDIWEDDEPEWIKVLYPLSYGSLGSKILITTRMDSVALMFAKMIRKSKEVLRLNGLEENECLRLLNTHAFDGVENPDSEFRSIAVKMVKKLSRSPLAAKVIGGILNLNVDKSYWTKVLNSNIGNLGLDHNPLLPILKLSYIYLSKYLQNCFSFCCIFPQDHEFDKDDIVRMWIALGFIQSSNIQRETLEDMGRRYFNILVQKSFFDEFRSSYGKVHYKMHDLLHELTQSVSAQECIRVEDDKEFSIPETTRHLSIHISSSLKAAFKHTVEFKNLRSLFLSISKDAEYDENILSEILKAAKNIRLLVINYPKLQKIPETIGCLIHSRYLKVECHDGFKLPGSISLLYHLQFIISKRLPDLAMDDIAWKELIPDENCQLIMDELVIKDPSLLLMEPLRRITSLRLLTIENNDELVSFPTETEQWFLQNRSSLNRLKLSALRSLQSLLSSLESLSSLNDLEVYNLPQLKRLPNLPPSLVKLKLHNLESLQSLPSSLPAISSLEDLTLINIPLLKSLQCLPSSLPSSSSIFPSLHHVKLRNIPLLESLPDLPSSLRELDLQELNSLQRLPSSLPAVSSLKHLKLKNIPLLESLPDLPSSLKELAIEKLESLRCLPPSLSTVVSLKDLELKNIPLLRSLPKLPSSIILLRLEKIDFLPVSLSAVSSLEHLILKSIPLLKSLPNLPSSLRRLHLEELDELDCLPSCLPALSGLAIIEVPQLLKLPDLPDSAFLLVRGCDARLMEQYRNFRRR